MMLLLLLLVVVLVVAVVVVVLLLLAAYSMYVCLYLLIQLFITRKFHLNWKFCLQGRV